MLVIPGSFLGGSAPCLRVFDLNGIPFPGSPELLLSATHLVELWLENTPHPGYISPRAMAALLCALSSLKSLSLGFQSPQSRPDWKIPSLPPPKRSILPALNKFRFKGVTEYLEELVAHIDSPQLDEMDITFFNQIDFDCPRLAQFIYRTPSLRAPDEVHVQFDDSTASVRLRYGTYEFSSDNIRISISCREPDWQLSFIEQVCNSSLHPLPMVEELYIEHKYSQLVWKTDAIENTLWSQLLLPFTAVKNLYLSKEFAPGSRPPCTSSLGVELQKCCLACRISSWRGLSHGDLFRKTLGSFLPCDVSPVTLSPFLSGTKTPAFLTDPKTPA